MHELVVGHSLPIVILEQFDLRFELVMNFLLTNGLLVEFADLGLEALNNFFLQKFIRTLVIQLINEVS